MYMMTENMLKLYSSIRILSRIKANRGIFTGVVKYVYLLYRLCSAVKLSIDL